MLYHVFDAKISVEAIVFYLMEAVLVILLPVLYLISAVYALYNVIVEAVKRDQGYRPSFVEWFYLGKKEFLSFRRATKTMPMARLQELADIYKFEQKNSDANASDIFEKVLPNKWMGVYGKACEYELARRA